MYRKAFSSPVPELSFLPAPYRGSTRAGERRVQDWTRRLEKVFPHLIERDQTGYIKGRYIGENIRAISDIIEQHENKEGMKINFS